MEEKRARFEDLMDFPAVTLMRVVCEGADEGRPVRDAALQVAARASLRPPVLTGSRASSGGHYVAHHIEVEVADADILRALYADLKAVPGVRLVL
jgi:putative lipoic acid-binding regulatory protein